MRIGTRLSSYVIKCKGRDSKGKEVLVDPVHVGVAVHNDDDSEILEINPFCVHGVGGYDVLCKASNSAENELVSCPFSLHLPLTMDRLRKA
jgi:hypothetical protein